MRKNMEQRAMKKGNVLPQEHWQDSYDNCMVGGGKYASEFGAEEELRRRENELARYVKNNRETR